MNLPFVPFAQPGQASRDERGDRARRWASVLVHTDGSFRRTGQMGWGAVICSRELGKSDVLGVVSGGCRGGSSVEAEARAVAEALEALPAQAVEVEVRTDCKNIIQALQETMGTEGYLERPLRRGIEMSTLERVREAARGRLVWVEWVPSHRGEALNEAADILAHFGSGGTIPDHPENYLDHPRARAAAIARLIEAPRTSV